MAKLTLNNVTNFADNSTAVTTTSANNDAIEAFAETVLSRDGSSPNAMNANIDMNSNRIINLATPINNSDAATKFYVDDNTGNAAQHAADAAESAQEAAESAQEAATYADIAAHASAASISVKEYGAEGDGVTDDNDAIIAADIAAIAAGVPLYFPPGTYRVSAPRYRSGSTWIGEPGKVILKLTDDADPREGLMPVDLDTQTTNVTMYGIWVDGNGDRPNITELTDDRPNGGSAILIAYVDGFYGERLRGFNALLHGIDIAGGGFLDGDGVRHYNKPGEAMSFPDNPSRNVHLVRCEGLQNGDDGITTHCSENIYLTDCLGGDSIIRYSSQAASNGIEIDDGSRRVWMIRPRGRGCNVGVTIKCHSGNYPPHDMHVVSPIAENCNSGFHVESGNVASLSDSATIKNVFMYDLRAINPVHFGVTTNALNGIRVAGAENVWIFGAQFVASGDEEDELGESMIVTDGARNVHVFGIHAENWPRAQDTNSAILLGTQSSEIHLHDVTLVNCGGTYGVDVRGSVGRKIIDGVYGRGISANNQTLVRFGDSVASSGSVVGGINPGSTGYDFLFDDGGTATNRGLDNFLGDVRVSGRIKAGATTSDDRHQITVSGATEGQELIRMDGTQGVFRAYESGQASFGGNSAANCFRVNSNATTGRSINARGTVNASGADYAEYHQVKEHLWGVVPKGAILGFTADGLLTDVFADVVGPFVVKSTNPYGVGGDAWGEDERICALYEVEAPGDRPEPDGLTQEEWQDQIDAWQQRKVAFEVAYETERAKWDRIAKTGYVPVNIAATTADIGKYAVPVDDGNGGITAAMKARDDLSLVEYTLAIGCVIGVTYDGRALVEVKVG